jgi:hypothetical protein
MGIVGQGVHLIATHYNARHFTTEWDEGRDTVCSDTLTKERALKIANSWCDSNVTQPKSSRGWDQFRWLMEEMAALCVAESVKLSEDEDQLYERLSKAHDILRDVQIAGAPEIANIRWKDRDELTDDQRKLLIKADATVWKRRDPKRSFSEGFESEHHTAFNPADFHQTVADYLKDPWLRHPVLDWIMMDLMISRELAAFGEELKQNLPYARNLFSGRWSRYYACKGDLRRMRKLDWRNLINKILLIALPLSVIYSALYIEHEKIGQIIAGPGRLIDFFVIAAIGVLGWQIFLMLLFYWFRRRWNRMYEVWQLLEGPIVNPSLVRETMITTRKKGIIWDIPAWSIIDRVSQHDPAVWVVRGGSAR